MLFVSIVTHLMQMAFLLLVEEPHIQRTYNSGSSDSSELEARQEVLMYDPRKGWFPHKRDSIFFWRMKLNVGDCSLVILIMYSAIISLQAPSYYGYLQIVAWRSFHWLGLGFLLYMQSNFKTWTEYFQRRDFSKQEAFSHWKSIFNLSLTMNIAVVVFYAIREANWNYLALLDSWNVACIAGVRSGLFFCVLPANNTCFFFFRAFVFFF